MMNRIHTAGIFLTHTIRDSRVDLNLDHRTTSVNAHPNVPTTNSAADYPEMNQKCKVLHATDMKTGYIQTAGYLTFKHWYEIILIRVAIFSVLMYVQKVSLFDSLDDEEENVKDICLNYI